MENAMDWMYLLTELILPIIGLLLTVLVVPYLREKNRERYALAAVKAAEQLFGGGTGTQKYAFVRQLLTKQFRMDEQDAQRLIEAAVYELNRFQAALDALPNGKEDV